MSDRLPHVIRLRGPWEQSPQPDGRVCYLRSFHRPTGLEGGAQVWLVVDPSAGEVLLNGKQLALGGRCCVTSLLEPNNRLSLTGPAGLDLAGLARLEIEG